MALGYTLVGLLLGGGLVLGAGIVAAHANGIGADVTFVTILGDDERAGVARSMLERLGITAHAFTDATRPTSLKQRFRAHGKTLLRVNHLRQHALGADAAARMVAKESV